MEKFLVLVEFIKYLSEHLSDIEDTDEDTQLEGFWINYEKVQKEFKSFITLGQSKDSTMQLDMELTEEDQDWVCSALFEYFIEE